MAVLIFAMSINSISSIALADVIDGEDLTDPTRPIFFTADSNLGLSDLEEMTRDIVPASYDLSFVRASDSSPMAVINERRVTVGDIIGGAIVVSIDRDGVVLSIDEQERRITLFGSSVKTPVEN